MTREERLERLGRARLYFVAGDAPGGRPLGDVLPAALRGGVDVFQLRMKDAAEADVLAAAEVARAACDAAGVLFLLNDRPDLATATQADGVHVGQEDAPVHEARALAGPARLVGVSTHGAGQLAAAAAADYAGVGPVYATPTKPGRVPVGLSYVRHAAAHAPLPWFAIGGIDPTNVAEVLRAGATRIVVVRAIAEAEDPEAAARKLKQAVEAHDGRA